MRILKISFLCCLILESDLSNAISFANDSNRSWKNELYLNKILSIYQSLWNLITG